MAGGYSPRIKICGLTRPADIAAANRWRPDYIGFVFAQSRRQVSPEQARQLKALLSPGILAVGVFVNGEPEEEAWLFDQGIIDLIQLHGQETEETIGKVKALTGGKAPVIKAVSVTGPESIRQWADSRADYLLLDNGPGGTGSAFDYGLIEENRLENLAEKPFFLAGGLDPENVRQAVRRLSPFGVDVSSGVETAGRKDEEKIRRFIRQVRAAE